MKYGKGFLGFASFLLASAVSAEDRGADGSGRFFITQANGISSERAGESLQSSLSGLLDLKVGPPEGFEFRTSLLGTTYVRSVQWGSIAKSQGVIRELELDWRRSGWVVRAGQQITSWGKTDAINPTDFLSGRDYRFFTAESELQKRGAPALEVSLTPQGGSSPWQVTTILQARPPETLFLVPAVAESDAASQEGDSNPFFSGREQGALKVSYLGSAYDFSFSIFEGRRALPQYFVSDLALQREQVRERALGADFSRTFDDFILRAEGAYFMNRVGRLGVARAGLTQPDHADLVLGAERPFGDRFRVIVQGVLRYHPSYVNPATFTNPVPPLEEATRDVGRLNALLHNYQDRFRPSSTLFVGYSDPEKGWEGELGWITNWVGGDFLLRPRVKRQLGSFFNVLEGYQGTLGASVYGGPKDRPFGALRSYSHAFLEVSRLL